MMDDQKRLDETENSWEDMFKREREANQRLQARVESLQAELDAWKSAFGNQQLTDASANYEAQLQKVSDLRSRCSTLDRRLGEAESALAREREERERLERAGKELVEANTRHFDALRAAEARVEKLEDKYRKLLWLGHGHMGLYGDDGEMQCNLYGPCDFKRHPLEFLEEHCERAKIERIQQALAGKRETWEAAIAQTKIITEEEKKARLEGDWSLVIKKALKDDKSQP